MKPVPNYWQVFPLSSNIRMASFSALNRIENGWLSHTRDQNLFWDETLAGTKILNVRIR